MTAETDLIKLYSGRILNLAASIPNAGRLDAPTASATRRAPLCGSTVTVDVRVEGGRLAAFAQDVKACALGQASAAVVGQAAAGMSLPEIEAGRDALRIMLRGGPPPTGAWAGLEVLVAARDFTNRHASILLSVEALAEAMAAAEARAA